MKIKQILSYTAPLLFLLIIACSSIPSNARTTVLEQPQEEATVSEQVASEVLQSVKAAPDRKYIRGIHLTANISGVSKHRDAVIDLFNKTELNTAVIDIKEMEGYVYIDGVKAAHENKAYFAAMKNVEAYLTRLKENDVYTVARIVVFRDNLMPRKKPNMAVKNPDGSLWTDYKGYTWLDPYNKDSWEYTFEIVERAIELGFEEIQFDYIRFPSDGSTRNCRYINPNHSRAEAEKVLVEFLKESNRRFKDRNVKISIDLFGMTTTATDDMGIGQNIVKMAEWVDYVSPMVYPSHYGKGDYGIPDPNKEPYKTIYIAMEGALKKGIPVEKLRPWLQSFSYRGVTYGAAEIRAQIQACYDNGIGDWLLWNAGSIYNRGALLENDEERTYIESDPPTDEMIKTQERLNKKKQLLEETMISESEVTEPSETK